MSAVWEMTPEQGDRISERQVRIMALFRLPAGYGAAGQMDRGSEYSVPESLADTLCSSGLAVNLEPQRAVSSGRLSLAARSAAAA